jgi:hypothetical protein
MALWKTPHHIREDNTMASRKRTPDQPTTETTTATADPPAAVIEAPQAANDNKPSFAERVGQRKWTPAPDPFGIASDYQAGVHLYESRRDGQMAIKFDRKPPQPVIDRMHEAQWIWKPKDQIWAYPLTEDSARTTRISAERLYQQVRQMVRQDLGIGSSPEVPF